MTAPTSFPSRSEFLVNLIPHGLPADTLAALQSHGWATVADLMDAMGSGGLRDVLTEDERMGLIRVLWRWLGMPLEDGERAGG